MNEYIDWEGMMLKAERSATGAAMNAERAIGGVAKVLEIQRLHSQQLASLKEALEAVGCQNNGEPRQTSTHHSQMTSPPEVTQTGEQRPRPNLALTAILALVVGMVFGAYIVN